MHWFPPSIPLKFTPTPQRNVIELKKDIEDFTHKLCLREYFSNNEPKNTENESLVKNKSSFYPPHNRNKTLDTVID